MAHADTEDLAALALDPADGTGSVRDHVATCVECSALLTSLVELRRLAGADPLVPAPEQVRSRVLAEAFGARSITSAPSRRAARSATRALPLWAAGLAAALALVAGLGLGRLTVDAEAPEAVDPTLDRGTVVAAADLTALDSDAARGVASAVRSDDVVSLRVEARALGEEDGFHEVWLINVDGTRMVALGVLASGDEGEFEVPKGLIEEGYRIVDISIEPEDGDPTHSGVSLARGELA